MLIISLNLLNLNRVMIIDLDAHQGNGHETDLGDDSMIKPFFYFMMLCHNGVWYVDNSILSADRVYILDMYNPDIYPFVSCHLWSFTLLKSFPFL